MRARDKRPDPSDPIEVQRGYLGYWGWHRMEADYARTERRYGQAPDGRRSSGGRPWVEDEARRFRAAYERYMAELDERIAELEREAR